MDSLIRLVLFLFSLCVASAASAQSYDVTVTNEPFSFMENRELAELDLSTNDWPVFEIPIGFDFTFFDITSNTIYSAANSFGGYTALNQDESDLYMLMHFYANFVQRGESQDSIISKVYFKTEGVAPNRIFNLEYNDMGFFFGLIDSDSGIQLDYINIQVRLYEASGMIEYHIGPYSVQEDPEEVFDGFPGPIIGIMSNVQNVQGGDFGEVVLLTGSTESPVITDNPFSFMEWPVPENTVFRFSRSTTSNVYTEADTYTSKVYPNPTGDIINVNANADFEYFEIYDLNGKKIQESKINAADITNLASGIYSVKITFKDKVHFHRITKI